MSAHERTDIEYQGTEPVAHLERSVKATLVHGGGSPPAGSERTSVKVAGDLTPKRQSRGP